MKYQQPKVDNTCNVRNTSPIITPPKGLSKCAYLAINSLNESMVATIGGNEDLSKEAIFHASKELSDLNIGYFTPNTLCGQVGVYKITEVTEYQTDFRALSYPDDEEILRTEFVEDVSNMAKEGYNLHKFAYCCENEIFLACFRRKHQEE